MLNVGDSVTYVDEHSALHDALITAIHNRTGVIETKEDELCCINVVYITSDGSKRDPYGQQVERASSVQGQSAHTAHGRYWVTK